MIPIEPLGMTASQWQFLVNVDEYVRASARKLVPQSTRRQFVTARDILERLNGSYGDEPRRGILLADDVGLGKTTVAAMVAWIVASAGERRGVRILAPNDVMVRRWEEELLSHVEPLQACAKHLDVQRHRVKARRVGRLSAGTIQIVKHSYAASDLNLTCDLLIVDEAHRAKGDKTAFSLALKRQKKHARRVLILTATPFSIRLEELQRMLLLIGADDARTKVRAFSRALDDLYQGNAARSEEFVAERLAMKAREAVDALSAGVIRHGIDDLPREHRAFGARADWPIHVPPAQADELELMLRADRALRISKGHDGGRTGATNDPRFHVGWRHLDAVRADLKLEVPQYPEPVKAVVENHLRAMKRLRASLGVHSKMLAVGAAVAEQLEQDEKVLLFCHHHATAQELTAYLGSTLPGNAAPPEPSTSSLREAWCAVLPPIEGEDANEYMLRVTFIDWLCSEQNRAQVARWLGSARRRATSLASQMEKIRARHSDGHETIAEAARALFAALVQSKSSRAVLKAAGERPEILPGADGAARVLGLCQPSDDERETHLFGHNQQPDTLIAIFNSPFGPDVLVATDRLSEGIDLHRYCRHLVHYELDPSPIRTVQRNGRLRRVNSWAATISEPIHYAYPAFQGTRDHRLVQIMKKRIDSFSLLLGGVHDFDVGEVHDSEEQWRNRVITLARARLEKAAGGLRARER